ncbi:Flap endonuclease-1 (rad27/fen1 family) [Giardia duodenalis]|uniref:Flap endonuclease-1 (Rad27/fen1 family) n=1 Tax=Giardia intestinalis TaxID=5741 RepID=V6TGR4_GIAIN|nr:Flap endonuclease-1 (rad27/fen1 family) [Giardia intestinalis]
MSASTLHPEDGFVRTPLELRSKKSESISTLKVFNSDRVASPVDVEDIFTDKSIVPAAKKGRLLCIPTDTEISHRNKHVTAFGDKPSDNQLLNVPVFEFSDEDKDLPELELSKVKVTTKIDQFDRNEKLTGLKSTYDFNSYTIDVSSKKSKPKDSGGFDSVRKQRPNVSATSSPQSKVPTYKVGDYIPRAVREQLKSSQKPSSPSVTTPEVITPVIDTTGDTSDAVSTASSANEPVELTIQNETQFQQLFKPQISMAFTTKQQALSISTSNLEASNKTISILTNNHSCPSNIWTTHQASACPVSFSDAPMCNTNASSDNQPRHIELQPGDTGFILSHYAATVQSDKA